MKKKVNIYPTRVIYNIATPITGVTLNQILSVGDIEKCLIANAKVEEVLSNGKTARLTLLNYANTIEEKRNELIEEATNVLKEDIKETFNTPKVEEVKNEVKVEEEVKNEVKIEEEEVKNETASLNEQDSRSYNNKKKK